LKLIEVFLEGYYVFKESPDIESRDFVMDIENAIRSTSLTTREKLVLMKLYFSGPQPPERDRLDKNGDTRGRPLGGATVFTVGQELNMDFRRVNEIKQQAIQKIAETLGNDFGV